MRNRRLGIILVIIILALIALAVIVNRAASSSDKDETGVKVTETEKPKNGGIFSKNTPEPTPPPEPTPTFTVAPEGYFDDALIIGDSRTEGIKLCAPIPGATIFSSVGMGVTGAFYETCSVPGVGSVNLDYLLQAKQFGKVYIMLGINEIASPIEDLAARFGSLVEKIKEAQPDAIIIIEANLRVTANYNSTWVTNERIDAFNEAVSKFADNEKVFYLDVNPLFDDGTGAGLSPAISPDGLHVPAAQYAEWAQWIMNNAVVFQ